DPQMRISVMRQDASGPILNERGGQTLSECFSAGALDRLVLTRAPGLLREAVPGIRFFGPAVISDALRRTSRRDGCGVDICTEYVRRAAGRHQSAQTPARLPGGAQ